MKEKVVFFVTTLDSGGIENYLLRFLQFQSQHFRKIIIVCKSGKAGHLEAAFHEFENVSIIRKKIGYVNITKFIWLYKFLKKERPQSICDFTATIAAPILYVSRLANIPKRVVFYRSSTLRYRASFFRTVYDTVCKKIILSCATNILANSVAAFKNFYPTIWKSDKRFCVLKNGVNSEIFLKEKKSIRCELGLSNNDFVVGHIGRYDPSKNHDAIIKVANIVTKIKSDIYVVLCGKNVKKSLTPIIEKKDLSGKVFLFENRNDVPNVLKTFNCFYFPSVTEGQPNALLEAMISGLPFVASNIEPIKEATPKEAHKYLIAANDIDGAVDLILNIYNKRVEPNFQTWAIENFDPSIWFKAFYNFL